jgi:outer membrane protein assembly factor BamB
MRGQAEIVANDETSYGEPRFNFYSAVVGSVVPFELTYTLLSGTWGPTTFDQAFSYSRMGWVDFANPISAPQLIDLELRGPGQVRESATYQYSTFAHYDSGGSREVTSLTEWSVQPASLASIERGALVTYELEGSEAQITISAAYEEGGVRLTATRDVAIKLEGELETDPTIWETYQGNRRHTGYVPISTDPLDFALRWQRQVGSGRPLNPVTAADGKVFASVKIYFNDETQLFTLDARDGETLWTKQFGAPFSVNPPAFGYGNVYVQTGNHGSDTWLRAYDANTGRELFSSRHSAQWERYFAPTIADGKVYINGGYYGGMYRFDAFSGRQDWFRDLQQYDEWTPAVDDRYAYAYMGEYTPGLYVVDRATGTHAFLIPDENFEWNGWSMNLAPVLGSMNDVIAIHDGRLISFDLGARKIRWEIPASFVGQPSIAKESIYAIDGGRLVARSEASGQLLWSWRPPSGTLLGSTIATDSHIFTRTSTNIYAIDILSQESVWSYPVSGELALGNDTLYIAGSDGMLTAISIPELLPVPPVRLSISGPVSVTEGSATQYKATVEYEDGRIRDRTIRAEWSLAPSDSATIDSRGVLSVGELFTPSEIVRINAAYTENGVTVHADVEVPLVIGVALSDFVKRNLEASLAIKERIARDVDEVLKREYAAKAVLAEMSNVGSGYLYRRSLMSLQLAIYWDEFSQIALDRSRAACESALMEFELGATAPPIGRPARAMSR